MKIYLIIQVTFLYLLLGFVVSYIFCKIDGLKWSSEYKDYPERVIGLMMLWPFFVLIGVALVQFWLLKKFLNFMVDISKRR